MLACGDKVCTDKKLSTAISEEWPATRRRISGKNRELKTRREWQRETHDAWKTTAAAVDQILFGDGEDGGVNETVKVAFRGDIEFVDADVEAIVIDRKVREVGDTRPALIGVFRKSRIQGVNQVGAGGIRRLADRQVKSTLLERYAGGGVELRPGGHEPALGFRVEQRNRIAREHAKKACRPVDPGR